MKTYYCTRVNIALNLTLDYPENGVFDVSSASNKSGPKDDASSAASRMASSLKIDFRIDSLRSWFLMVAFVFVA